MKDNGPTSRWPSAGSSDGTGARPCSTSRRLRRLGRTLARRLAREPQDEATRRAAMQAANPVYIPRNHRVEAALAAAIEDDDFAPFEELLAVLAQPVRGAARIRRLRRAAGAEQRTYRTFCGT